MSEDQTALSILLVEDNPADAEWIAEALGQFGSLFRCQHAETLAAALERLRRAAPDVVLLDLMLPDSRGLDTFRRLQDAAGDAALVVLSGLQDQRAALEAVREGAQDYLIKGRISPEVLARALQYAAERQRNLQRTRAQLARRKPGEVIAFIGAKGGVGTTTVASNVAASLARSGSVVAAEIDGFGAGFVECFRLPGLRGTVWELARPSAEEVARQLWKLPSGLRILPGPAAGGNFAEASAEQVDAVVEALSWLADRVILDLPARASNAVAAALRRADQVVLVAEREPGAVAAGRRLLEFLRTACRMEGLVRAVIVNRVSFACPMPLNDIERCLEAPIIAVMPPNADLCQQARRAGAPVVFFQPESALATSLTELASKLVEGVLSVAHTA